VTEAISDDPDIRGSRAKGVRRVKSVQKGLWAVWVRPGKGEARESAGERESGERKGLKEYPDSMRLVHLVPTVSH